MVHHPEALPTSTIIPSLVRWGLSPDADLVYRTLVSFGPSTLPHTARELGMSHRRTAAALDELVAEHAVRPLRTGSMENSLWRAGSPQKVIQALRHRRLRIADPWAMARRHLAVVTGIELTPHLSDTASRHIRLLHTPELIQGRIAELTRLERHERLTISPEPAFDESTLEVASPLDRELLRRGVRLHVLSAPPADGDASAAHTEELHKLGARLRQSDQVPIKLMTFDRKVALLPIDPLDARRGAMEITAPMLVERLVAIFLRDWDSARDPRHSGVPAITLTEREQALVELLAAGLTDPAASRRLGISSRTIGYTMRALMDRLGVENRFQLGLALGARRIYQPGTSPTTGQHTTGLPGLRE